MLFVKGCESEIPGSITATQKSYVRLLYITYIYSTILFITLMDFFLSSYVVCINIWLNHSLRQCCTKSLSNLHLHRWIQVYVSCNNYFVLFLEILRRHISIRSRHGNDWSVWQIGTWRSSFVWLSSRIKKYYTTPLHYYVGRLTISPSKLQNHSINMADWANSLCFYYSHDNDLINHSIL